MSEKTVGETKKEKKKSRAPEIIIIILVMGLIIVNYFEPENRLKTPVVVSTNPTNNEFDVDSNLNFISVTFDRPMNPEHYSWVRGYEADFPKTSGKTSFDSKHKTCKLPVVLEPNKTYEILINSEDYNNFRSKNGTPSKPNKLIFSTGS